MTSKNIDAALMTKPVVPKPEYMASATDGDTIWRHCRDAQDVADHLANNLPVLDADRDWIVGVKAHTGDSVEVNYSYSGNLSQNGTMTPSGSGNAYISGEANKFWVRVSDDIEPVTADDIDDVKRMYLDALRSKDFS